MMSKINIEDELFFSVGVLFCNNSIIFSQAGNYIKVSNAQASKMTKIIIKKYVL